MRLIIVLLAMSLAAEPARSQVLSTPAKPRDEPPSDAHLHSRMLKELTDCEGRWEAATHMTNNSSGPKPVDGFWIGCAFSTCMEARGDRTHNPTVEVMAGLETTFHE